MATIGIVGQGFVGTAVFEGFSHTSAIIAYDKKMPNLLRVCNDGVISTQATRDGMLDVVLAADILFVCVPTPMLPNGASDISIVESVIEQVNKIAADIHKIVIIVVKSTVVPGTLTRLGRKFANVQLVFNPEFLTERFSVQDFKQQSKIILGGEESGVQPVAMLYNAAFPNVPVYTTSSQIAEMVKYVSNCFLAIKLSFANEIYELCGRLGLDYDQVISHACLDKRLGDSHWSVPGPDGKRGFSGSCLPKDLNAIIYLCEQMGIMPNTMSGAWATNLRARPERDWELLKGRAVAD